MFESPHLTKYSWLTEEISAGQDTQSAPRRAAQILRIEQTAARAPVPRDYCFRSPFRASWVTIALSRISFSEFLQSACIHIGKSGASAKSPIAVFRRGYRETRGPLNGKMNLYKAASGALARARTPGAPRLEGG